MWTDRNDPAARLQKALLRGTRRTNRIPQKVEGADPTKNWKTGLQSNQHN